MSPTAHDIMASAMDLQRQDRPYALVSVLRAQAPASARPGDKAVVTAEGIVQGWIGGGCAQPAVLRTVRQALADGCARMIRITPAGLGEMRELDEVLEFGMACHSGGTLELFIDPMLPRQRLTLIGDSPVAQALAGLAPRVGFAVCVVAPGATAERFPDAAQVVATQGRRDVQGLRAALALRARQVSFVASARKAQVLRAALVESGQDAAAVAAIVAPAGQPIGAQTPEEIALSVLAAVVAARRGGAVPQAVPAGLAGGLAAGVAAGVVNDLPAPQPRPVVAALPDLPAMPGSCCGGG